MSAAFWNAFWLFLGIVAGALVQFLLNWIVQYRQRVVAKNLLKVEIAINRAELKRLREFLLRRKERFVAQQVVESDFFIDMSGFNYRMMDPLINTGLFHAMLGSDGVSRYFRFANELNVQGASNLTSMLRKESEAGKSLEFLDWLLDEKLPEWQSHLDAVEGLAGGPLKLTGPKKSEP